MAKVRLKIDISNGTLEVDCNGDDFDEVMSSAARLLDKFSSVSDFKQSKAGPKETPDLPSDEAIENDGNESGVSKTKPKAKRRKGSGTANWKVVEQLLSEEQRADLKTFYEKKAPGIQNHQVAVLAHKLSELLGRDGFDGHEIHTAFQAVGAKTPANLTGVFGNMTGEDLGKIVEKKWTPNFKSSDLVKHDLPAPPKD